MFIGIFLTPFHIKIFKTMNFSNEEGYYFVSMDVSSEYVRSNFDFKKVIYFQKINFRRKDFFKSPIKKLLEYRREIKNYKGFIKQFLNNLVLDKKLTLYIFTEKDVFVQIFINQVKKISNCTVIAIDEGMGFYLKNNWKDYILKIIYPIICFLLFGFPYKYYKVLGTSNFIDVLYLRLPEFIYGKRKCKIYKINYYQTFISFEISDDNQNNSVLLLTSPFSEDRVLSLEDEIGLIQRIINFLENRKYIISIKPHPRENKCKYDFLKGNRNIIFLEKEIISEEINYFKYKFIINFTSSAIIDIMLSGYPLSKVITIDLNKYTKKTKLFFVQKL
jgi:hypothetical protein